nr:putative 2K protein [Tamana bat virus]
EKSTGEVTQLVTIGAVIFIIYYILA